MPTARSHSFPRQASLRGQGAFTRVMDERIRASAGPLVMHLAASSTSQSRLGISIGRKVGNAVVRNRIKRLLRESFRLSRAGWPRAYNLVVIVRPHASLKLAEYQSLLATLIRKCGQTLERRQANDK